MKVAFLSTVVAFICFYSRNYVLRVGLVAWLATNILLYRVGLSLVHYEKPCSCLGTLTEALHIPPQTADNIMKIILAYLLIGSYACLFWLWRQRQTAVATPAQ